MSSIGPGDRHSVNVESYIQFADDELRANLNELTTQELSQLISNANQEMTKSRKRDFSDTPPSQGSDRVGAVMDIAKSVLIKKNESQITPEALEKKNGKVWDCVDAKIDPESGGVLYTFSFNQEKADKYSDLYRATFPPVEPDGDEGTFEGFEMLSELNIGYSCDRSRKTMTLPDSRYLSHQWKKLQEEQADLPDFIVCDSEGIASDDDFVEAMFTYDAVLSTEGEMVHDHSVHILPLVMELRSQGEGYTNAKGLFRDLIREIWDEIKDVESLMDVSGESFVTYNGNEISRKELNQMKTLVGIAVDSANSFQFLNVVPNLIMEASSSKGSKLELLLRFPKQDLLWLRYMGDKYQDQHITIGDLETLAKKLSPSQNQHKRAVDQVHSKRYPCLARTPDGDTFSGYSYSIKRNSVLETCFKLINDHIQQLGFREDFNGDKPFFFPDAELMTQRWEELQQSHPELPDLRIYSRGGEDVSAFLEPSPEFVSNHLLIVLPNLLAALEAENPKQIPELARFREGMFAELIELLEYAEELQDQIQKGSSLPIRSGEIEDYMYGVVLIAEQLKTYYSAQLMDLAKQFPEGKGIFSHIANEEDMRPRKWDRFVNDGWSAAMSLRGG